MATANPAMPFRRLAGRIAPEVSRRERRRALGLMLGLVAAFGAVGGQLVLLGVIGAAVPHLDQAQSIGRMVARPDILDRKGRLLATDIITHSLFADPSRIRDLDETVDRLTSVISELDPAALRKSLADRTRRFVWIERELTPAEAKRVHDLGLPGLDFRAELTRAYPSGEEEGHLLGFVDGDYKGKSGIERYIDEVIGVDVVEGPVRSSKPPVRLTIDLAAQHALRAELAAAMVRYRAAAAGAVVLDARSGEVVAMASLPGYGAGDAAASLDALRLDRMAAGSYELGSVFKAVTLAVAAEKGIASPGRLFDAREPIIVGNDEIDDPHGEHRELTAEEVFTRSSNIGAARMGELFGEEGWRQVLAALRLDQALATEIGPGAAPQLPDPWTKSSTLTLAFGHGVAISPLAFAAATAALIENGSVAAPSFVARSREQTAPNAVFSAGTVETMRALFRANVEHGTGRKAAVEGYDVGGKTGTADIAGRGGYGNGGVIASFLAAFPMSAPRYIVLTILWEPKASEAVSGQRTAAFNAAPTTAAIITRLAPILGLAPERSAALGP